MLFKYQAIDQSGKDLSGSIGAINVDVAISSLQRRGLIVSSIVSAEKTSFLQSRIKLFDHVPTKDIVILSRQIATLFEAQISVLRAFRLLASEATNALLGRKLLEITDDLQSGNSISKSLSNHPDIFSPFYVNMVRSGEESGKLNETFLYLADYLDRNYEISSKVKNALIYPAFIIFTFVVVMSLMLTLVIPKISSILIDSGQEIPTYTKIVISISNALTDYGIFILIAIIFGGFILFRYGETPKGKLAFSRFKISIPYVGDLYRKLYLARIADNFSTMLTSGIPILRAIEITGSVVNNDVYAGILNEALIRVKGGTALSEALSGNKEIPGIMIQMVKVGEESGELGKILKMLAKFYNREVSNAVDTIVDLIEPVLIVLLGLGVGLLLASVLIPIYDISANA